MHLRHIFLGIAALLVIETPAAAQTVFADTVITYQESGTGLQQEPYGGELRRGKYRLFPLRDRRYAIDANGNTFLSLPKGASITVGFSNAVIFDGPNDDLFIKEVGSASELAEIYISTDFGKSFVYLGKADGGTVTRFDLRTINFDGIVNAVKIIGLDTKGGSPGFDVAYVEGLQGSIQLVKPIDGESPLSGLLKSRGEEGKTMEDPPNRPNPAAMPADKPTDNEATSLQDLLDGN